MDNLSSSLPNVPAIHIQDADDSPQFQSGDIFNIYNSFLSDQDGRLFHCQQSPHSDFNPLINDSTQPDLEDMPELSHLTATLPNHQPFLTGHHYSAPYSDPHYLQDGSLSYLDGGLSPSSLGTSDPSPSSSFASLSSPSFYDLSLSDAESPISPPLATPDHPYFFPGAIQSNESLIPFSPSVPDESISPTVLDSQVGPQRRRSPSVSQLPRPVASQAMLEANGRRRRHPAQFQCEECGQTFTALFSLKRHRQSHTGERPFSCGIAGCGQRFFNSSDCKRHEKSRKRHKELLMQ